MSSGATKMPNSKSYTVVGDQPLTLSQGFNAFGNHLQAQISAQIDNGADHRGIAWRIKHIGNKQAVDLQRIQIEMAQVGKR